MDFDEWMNKNYSSAFDMPHQREAYEAGQQSKQAEIDVLQQQNQRLAMRLDVIQRGVTEADRFDCGVKKMTISRLRDLVFLWVFLYALWFDKVTEWQLVCATLVYIFVRGSIYVSSKLD